MKKLMYHFSGAIVATLMVVANLSASTYCWFSYYQPEVPQSLRK
jgi:cyclic lactone autoinducer peptide